MVRISVVGLLFGPLLLSIFSQIDGQGQRIYFPDLIDLCFKPPATVIENYCYLLSNTSGSGVSWFEARRQCILNGGKLAVIQNNMTQTGLMQALSDKNVDKSVWIGLHKNGTEFIWDDFGMSADTSCPSEDGSKKDCTPGCHEIDECEGKLKDYCQTSKCCYEETETNGIPHCFFYAIDGEKQSLNYTYWAEKQPDSKNDDLCGVLWKDDNNSENLWKWDDQSCDTPNQFICQFDITNLTFTTTSEEISSTFSQTTTFNVQTRVTETEHTASTSYDEPKTTNTYTTDENTRSTTENNTPTTATRTTSAHTQSSSGLLSPTSESTVKSTFDHSVFSLPSTKNPTALTSGDYIRSSSSGTPSTKIPSTVTTSSISPGTSDRTTIIVTTGNASAVASSLSGAEIGGIVVGATILITLLVVASVCLKRRRNRGNVTTKIIQNMVSRDSRAYSEIPIDNMSENPAFYYRENDNRFSNVSTVNVTVANGEASVLYSRPHKRSKGQGENGEFVKSISIDINETPLKGEANDTDQLYVQPWKNKHQNSSNEDEYSYAETVQNIESTTKISDDEQNTYSYAEVRQRIPELKEHDLDATNRDINIDMVINPIYGD